jgi:hypothetical protein
MVMPNEQKTEGTYEPALRGLRAASVIRQCVESGGESTGSLIRPPTVVRTVAQPAGETRRPRATSSKGRPHHVFLLLVSARPSMRGLHLRAHPEGRRDIAEIVWLGDRYGWVLSMVERWGQCQRTYRLKAFGPHRPLADELFDGMRERCERCRGSGGIIGPYLTWRSCPECDGSGGFWTREGWRVDAALAEVLRQFPDAAAPPPDDGEEEDEEEEQEQARPEPPDPWSFLTEEALAGAIDAALQPDPSEQPASGMVLAPTQYVSIQSALRAAVPADADERLRFELGLEELDTDQMDRLVVRFSPMTAVLRCWVSDSMVAGSWELLEFRLGDRGYLCDRPDWGINADESFPILGAWQPAADDVARRACILSVYEREWDSRAWPPYGGQWAIADPSLLQEAILRVLDRNGTWARERVLEWLTEAGESYEDVEAVAELNG